MIANTLCQFVTQTGFREPLQGRSREIADGTDRLVYETISPREPERSQRARIVVYTIAAYLALC